MTGLAYYLIYALIVHKKELGYKGLQLAVEDSFGPGIHNGIIFNLLGVSWEYERTGLAYYFIYALIVQKPLG